MNARASAISRWVRDAPDVVVGAVAVVTTGLTFAAFGTVAGADTDLYVRMSRSIADGGFDSFGFPLQVTYGIALAPGDILGLSLDSWVVPLHVALGVGTAIVFRRLACLFVGSTTALLVGLAAACYPSLLFWTHYILSESLFVFVIGLFALAGAHVVVDGRLSRRRVLALAATTVMMIFTRPTGGFIALSGLLTVAYTVVSVQHGVRTARRVLAASAVGVVLLATLVLVVPAGRDRVLGNATVAQSLWKSTRVWRFDIDHVSTGQLTPPDLKQLPADERDRELSDRALTWIEDHPVDYVTRSGLRFGNFWFPWVTAAWGSAHRLGDALLTVLLYGGAVAAVLLARPGRQQRMVVLLGVLALTQGALVMISQIDSEARYRLPAEAALLPLLAIPVDRFIEGLGARRRPAAATAKVAP